MGLSNAPVLCENSATPHLYQRAAYALARTGANQDAVVVLERGRTRGLREALARDRADLQRIEDDQEQRQVEQFRIPEDGGDLGLVATYWRRVEELRRLEIKERAESVPKSDQLATALREAHAKRLRTARKGFEQIVTRIRAVPGYDNFLKEPTFEDIAKAILPDSPLVYLLTTPAGSMALIVAAEGGKVSAHAVRSDTITSALLDTLLIQHDIQTGNSACKVGTSAALKWLKPDLATALSCLGTCLMVCVATHLQKIGAKSMMLVPCGRLALFPLHAAQYEKQGTTIHLLDEFVVAYTPSAMALAGARMVLARRTNPATPTFVGIGHSVFHPRPLPFAQAELKVIGKLFAPDACQYPHEDADADSVQKLMHKGTYLHLSCHGMFDPEAPLNSRLELSSLQALTLRTILEQEPFQEARLVVLSACQTAISEFHQLPDESIGLPAGFLQAGAPAVIGTLWAVNDLSTMLLMEHFYIKQLNPLSRMTPSAALRKAQLWLRDVTAGELTSRFTVEKQKPAQERLFSYEQASIAWRRFVTMKKDTHPFADPYYWAAFTFSGT